MQPAIRFDPGAGRRRHDRPQRAHPGEFPRLHDRRPGDRRLDRKRVTVRNGTIRDFEIGIYLENLSGNSIGHLMENLVVERSKHSGMIVDGKHSVIRNNRIMETGSMRFAYGIFAAGEGIHVIGNVVTGIVEASGGDTAAITAFRATGGAVERNVVGNPAFGPSRSTGIVVSGGTSRITLVGNRVINMRPGPATTASELEPRSAVPGELPRHRGLDAFSATRWGEALAFA
jgi:hypothetical protein